VPISAAIPPPSAPVFCALWTPGAPAWVVPLFWGQSPNYGHEIAGVLGPAKNPAKSWRSLQDFGRPDSAKAGACQSLPPFRHLSPQFSALHRHQGCRRGLFLFFRVNPRTVGMKFLAFRGLPKIPQSRGVFRVLAKFCEDRHAPPSARFHDLALQFSSAPHRPTSGKPARVVPLFPGQPPNYGHEIPGVLGPAKNPAESWRLSP